MSNNKLMYDTFCFIHDIHEQINGTDYKAIFTDIKLSYHDEISTIIKEKYHDFVLEVAGIRHLHVLINGGLAWFELKDLI